jgi:hypothetical protein
MALRTLLLAMLTLTECGNRPPVTMDGGTDGGAAVSPCPSSRPAPSSACAVIGLSCEYGTDIRPECRARGECTATGWLFTEPACQQLPTVMCPASRDAAAGQSCTPVDAYCDYSGLLCHCTNCVKYPVAGCSGPLKWDCQAPIAEPQCPTAPPRIGDACTTPDATCTYACDNGRQCTNGAWQPWTPPNGCPRSSAQVKRDIHYLDAAERQALSERVLKTPLASYRYTEMGSTSPKRLGFIIEDNLGRYSVAPDERHVDLYGYVSELLATVQVQQAQLEALRLEVERLKAVPARR